MQKFLLLAFCLPALTHAKCVDFYFVKRPVATTAVMHEFVAAEASADRAVTVFGLPKGDDDRAHFARYRAGKRDQGLVVQRLGSACGARADEAMAMAKARSDSWRKQYERWSPYLLRMVATPVMGKPCAKSAQDVRRHVAPLLKK